MISQDQQHLRVVDLKSCLWLKNMGPAALTPGFASLTPFDAAHFFHILFFFRSQVGKANFRRSILAQK